MLTSLHDKKINKPRVFDSYTAHPSALTLRKRTSAVPPSPLMQLETFGTEESVSRSARAFSNFKTQFEVPKGLSQAHKERILRICKAYMSPHAARSTPVLRVPKSQKRPQHRASDLPQQEKADLDGQYAALRQTLSCRKEKKKRLQKSTETIRKLEKKLQGSACPSSPVDTAMEEFKRQLLSFLNSS